MIPIKTKKGFFYLGVLGALAIVLSCSPKIDKLEIIRIGNFRLDSIMHEIVSLRAEILIRNPYSSSATLKNITFDLALTDHPIAYGKLSGSTELKGGSTAVLDVPLAIQSKQITEKDFSALFEKIIPYRITGTAILEKPFGPRTLPIDVRNRIPSAGDLQFLLSNKSALKLIALDASGTHQLATLIGQRKLSLQFFNPFSFPLSIESFHTDVHLGKAWIADGVAEEMVRLEPGKNHLTLRVQPHSSGAASELFNSLFTKTLPDLTVSSDFQVVRNDQHVKIKLIYAP